MSKYANLEKELGAINPDTLRKVGARLGELDWRVRAEYHEFMADASEMFAPTYDSDPEGYRANFDAATEQRALARVVREVGEQTERRMIETGAEVAQTVLERRYATVGEVEYIGAATGRAEYAGAATPGKTYVVVEQAGYVGEKDGGRFATYKAANDHMRDIYTDEEIEELHVDIRVDYANGESSYEV